MTEIAPPNRWPLPPVVTIGTMAVCYVLHRLYPWPIEGGAVMSYIGIAIIVLAIALDVWAALTFRRHAANIMPHRAASTLIESGPFALSRNPIYLANVMLTLGVGLALDSRWFLLGAAALILVLQRFAIAREEAHMATLFGQAWQEYTLRVRRWI